MADQINVDVFVPEKQTIPDNVLSFVPKTGTTRFDKQQAFEIVIPRTNHVVKLNKAYFQVTMKLAIDRVGTMNNWFVGMNNAACIFDQVQIKNNGNTIYTNTYSQISSRLWQMSKSKEYLDSMPYCFINYDDITKNEGFIYKRCSEISSSKKTIVEFNMRIPIGLLFPCFDNCNSFSTTQLADDIILTLQLSEPYKYLTLVKVDSNNRVERVEKFYSEDQILLYGTSTAAARTPTITDSISFINNNTYLHVTTDSEYYYIDAFKMNVPCHYPTDDEKQAFSSLVSGGSVSFPFKTWDIDKHSVCLTQDSGGATTEINSCFSTNVKNIYGLMILFISDDNRVIFDKPYIEQIECNLNEIIKLANERVHKGSTYTRDNDMYRDFCNNYGTDYFKNLSRFDYAITHDYSKHETTTKELWGSYCQWYQMAAGNQMGFSGDYFANLINYKCKSLYDGKPLYNATSTGLTTTPNNRKNASIVCAALTQQMLLFRNGGISIITPESEEMNMRNVISGENQTHGIGLISAISRPVTSAARGLIGLIKDRVDERRANKNTTYAYTTLGKDKYENHKEIIEKNQAWKPRKFREFIDRLQSLEHGLFVRHGADEQIASDAGIPSASSNIDIEKGITLEDINLPYVFNYTYQLDLYSKEYKSLLPLDYKSGLNRYKLHLTSYGNEMCMENINASHGLRSWLRDKWSRFRNWIHNNKNDIGKNLKENSKSIIRQYVQDIMMGKIKPQNVPSKFKSDVLAMLQNGSLTGTSLDKLGSDAIKYYHDFKNGKIKADQIPPDVFSKIKDLSTNDDHHGLFSRHGFIAPIHIKSSIPTKNMKTRIMLMSQKDPNLLSQKDLKQMYMYKYLKKSSHHGSISSSVWKRLRYGNHKYINDRVDDTPKSRYDQIINKYCSSGTIKSANQHGLPTVGWKSYDKNIRRKLKKMGYNKNSQISSSLIDYINKKIEKKRLKKGVKGSL